MSHMPPPPPPPSGGYGAPPPHVPGQTRPGELLDRFLARLIDGILLAVVFVPLFIVLGAIFIVDASYNARTGEFDDGSTFLFNVVLGIILGALSIAYYAFMESSRGATVGKQLMKLKVVGPDGHSNPTLEQAARRNIFTATPLGYIIPILGPLIAGAASLVGQILIAVGINNDPVRRQAWHDKFAGGTQVLKVG